MTQLLYVWELSTHWLFRQVSNIFQPSVPSCLKELLLLPFLKILCNSVTSCRVLIFLDLVEKQLFWYYLNSLYGVSVVLVNLMSLYQCHEWQQSVFTTHILRKCLSWYLVCHWWLHTAAFVSCFFLLANFKYSFKKFKENMLCKHELYNWLGNLLVLF